MSLEQLDLLGAPVIRRSAWFPHEGVRLLLSRRWGHGPNACVIGCNPSLGNGQRDDPTIRWLIEWFRAAGFDGFDLVNLYPFISPDPVECRRIVERIDGGDWWVRDRLHFENLPFVVRRAKAADQVFVCWGAIAWDPQWTAHVVEEITTGEEPWPDLWCWGTTQSGAPKHPMARGLHRIPRDQAPILWRAARGLGS